MKRVLLAGAVTVAVLAGLAWTMRVEIFLALAAWRIGPDHAFEEQPPPAAPDYDSAAHWAALPELDDPGDQLPGDAERAPTGVAVFFVHPTTFFGKRWNQPLDDEDANWIVEERVLRHQASVFNSCCEIHAPRYRQATFYSFMDDGGDGERALDLAYTDVAAAFAAFLARIGPEQPFIVAGHSQGTRHATRLVREEVTGTPLAERLVGAWLIGFSITHDQLGALPACDGPEATGCALGWNAVLADGEGAFGDAGDLLCTNPLDWRDGGGRVEHERNLGGIGYLQYAGIAEGEDVTAMRVEPAVADAACREDGQLAVTELRSGSFPARMGPSSLHPYDYSLYHMNIRENVARRIAAWYAAR